MRGKMRSRTFVALEALRLVMADPMCSGVDLMDCIGFRPQ